MFFTRTHSYHFPVTKDDLTNRLIGRHVNIHDLDFEIMEKDEKLLVIPHAEQVNDIKTLPITSVVMTDTGGQTKVVVTSRMRQLDSGGPFLILIFCALMFVVSGILYFVGEAKVSLILLGICASIFTIFWIRLETGYFDYVRKIHAYIKSKAAPSVAEARMPMAQA